MLPVSLFDRIIRWGFYLLFALVPLLLTPLNYELFEYNKMMAVYAITVVVVGSWLVKMISQKEIRIAKTPLDVPILVFLSSQLLSSLFSMDPHVSWFGYYSRFNGGMWSVISYILLYWAFVSNFDVTSDTKYVTSKNKKEEISHVSPFLKVSLFTATLVAFYGVLERMGIDKHLWVQDVQNRVFSTLGQPNWLAAYLVALAPLTWYLALRTQNSNLNVQRSKKNFNLPLSSVFWVLVSLLFFLVLLFTRSRSGLLGFAVADLVFWGLLWFKQKGKHILRLPLIAYHALLVAIVFFNGTGIDRIDTLFTLQALKERVSPPLVSTQSATPAYTAPLLEAGGTESGTIRKYVWQGAINAWNSSWKARLIGTGTETFAFAFYQFRPAEHNLTSEWDFLYNKAHNEYLNYLATTGLLGLLSYLVFIGVFIYWFIKKFLISNLLISKKISRSKSQLGQLDQLEIRSIQIALFAGWLSILVTNFFGFSVVTAQLFLFLFPAILFVSSLKQFNNVTMPWKMPHWTMWLLVVSGLVLLGILGRFWYADTLFAQGYRSARAGSYGQAQNFLERAVRLNSGEPLYHDELGTTLAELALSTIEGGDATGGAKLAQQSLAESDRVLTQSPRNVNFWKSRTKIFYAFSAFDPQFNTAAIKALETSLALSPVDPKIVYNLAILHGRAGDNARAIELLQTAITLKRDYRDAYYALFVFYNEVKLPQEAQAIIRQYLADVDPNDKDFQERIR